MPRRQPGKPDRRRCVSGPRQDRRLQVLTAGCQESPVHVGSWDGTAGTSRFQHVHLAAESGTQLKAYNLAVLKTIPTGTSGGRVAHMREVITGWYAGFPGDTTLSGATQNGDFLPVGWRETCTMVVPRPRTRRISIPPLSRLPAGRATLTRAESGFRDGRQLHLPWRRCQRPGAATPMHSQQSAKGLSGPCRWHT